MKYLKILGLAAVAAMAMTAFTAGSASATTLEVHGVTQNSSVTIGASLLTGTKAILKDTAGFATNECSVSTAHGATATPFTGSSVTGALSSLTFSSCTREPVVVHKPGKLEVTYTSGTNGTVASEEAEVTVPGPGFTLTCKTAGTTNLGTLTGVSTGNATLDINAVLNCGIIPSAKWEATYEVTIPGGSGNPGLGVSS